MQNQVKELEHANRRFKVKIDMLEREKNTITKKHDAKLEDLNTKNKALEEQLAEWESKASILESNNRETAKELEAKLAAESRRVRDLEMSLESAESKAISKMKSMEMELEELRESSTKIEEYEQVLGKLMERNQELEEEAKQAKEERDMANRQVDLADRRKAIKVKDLEETIAEQKLIIEQQQETLDESVKTILKLYSLNNGKGDDMSTMSEEKLTDIARAMVPRLPSRSSLPTLPERPPSPVGTLASSYSRARQSSSRGRALTDEVESLMYDARARSRGRDRLEELDYDKLAASRPKSRGRGERSESIRQLTARAHTPSRDRSRSPLHRQTSNDRTYDPTGPNSLALVPVMPKESSSTYGGQYGIPPPRSSSARRGGGGGYDRVDSTYTDGMSYSSAIVPRQTHDRPRSFNQQSSVYRNHDDLDRDRNRRDRDRRREDRGGGGWDESQRHRDRGGSGGAGGGYPNRPGSRGGHDSRQNRGYSHEEDAYSRRSTRDPSISGDTMMSGDPRRGQYRNHGGKHRSGGGKQKQSRGHDSRSRLALDP